MRHKPTYEVQCHDWEGQFQKVEIATKVSTSAQSGSGGTEVREGEPVIGKLPVQIPWTNLEADRK